jgi:DNA primase
MRDQVEEVKSKIDIVDIVSEYVTLKKAGSNFKGLCPFHSEKSPSFMVNGELQIFKCFGCSESGDVFTFLEKYEGMEFPEALKYLAEKTGVFLHHTQKGQKDDKERLYEVNNLVHRFYQYMLHQHTQGKSALEYLTKVRGLSMETIKTFEIGFAPDDYSGLEKVFVRKKRATTGELEKLGLVFLHNGRPTDRFRGRIMFPLYDHRGNLQGFAGRILPALDKGNVGKYINSPETILYKKSYSLFGLWFTRKEIKQKKYAVLVEGPLDAIASYQGGIKNVAAIQGTSLTQEQVKLLSRFTKKIVFCLDSDFAGDAAERRGIQIAEQEGLEIRVARLTEFKDPGEAGVSDPKGFQKTIDSAIGVWDFILDSVFNKYKTKDGEEKAKISRELIPLLATIEDHIVQAHYVNETAKRLRVPVEAVTDQMRKKGVAQKMETPDAPLEHSPKIKTRQENLEENLLSLAFSYNPQYLLLHDDIVTRIVNPLYKRIANEFLTYAKHNSSLDMNDFAQILSPELTDGLQTLMLKDWDIDKQKEPEYANQLDRLNGELELLILRSQLDTQAQEIKTLTGPEKRKKLLQVQKNFQKLQKLQSQLEQS